MTRFGRVLILICGIAFGLAAFPVYGQENFGEEYVIKKPLEVFVNTYADKRIDWTTPFRLEMTGVIEKSGNLDRGRCRVVKSEGDAELIAAATEYVYAFGESRWLYFLSSQGVTDIAMAAVQNVDAFRLDITMPMISDKRAATFSSGLNTVGSAALLLDKTGKNKLGDDERLLLNSSKVTSTGKNVTISLALPAKVFQEMVRRHLKRKPVVE